MIDSKKAHQCTDNWDFNGNCLDCGVNFIDHIESQDKVIAELRVIVDNLRNYHEVKSTSNDPVVWDLVKAIKFAVKHATRKKR